MRTQSDGSLNRMFEFPNVARPPVSTQQFHGFGGDLLHRRNFYRPVQVEEPLRQGWNVLRALSQGRYVDRDDIHSIIEIFAECPCADERFEGQLGSRNNPHVQRRRSAAPDTPDLLLLDDS